MNADFRLTPLVLPPRPDCVNSYAADSLAKGTVRQLKAVFGASLHHLEPWRPVGHAGNPVDSNLARGYVRFARAEQSRVGATFAQASPAFATHFRQLERSMHGRAMSAHTSSHGRVISIYDFVLFCIAFHTARRGVDLS